MVPARTCARTIMRGIAGTALAVAGAALPAAETAAQRPNIVVILADDLGWSDLGCYGNPIVKTPNIDRLAQQGTRLTQAYAACPVCGPTRACLMTGQNAARFTSTNWGGCAVPAAMTTLPEALRDGGYETWFMGKWHLGGKPEELPTSHGFDLNIGGGIAGQPPSFFAPYKLANMVEGPQGEYLTDRLADEAIARISAAGKRPFALYLAHYAVHLPFQAKPEDAGPYQGSYRQSSNPKNLPTYAGMIANLDSNVGRVLQALDQRKLSESTLVIFTSDNGGYFPESCLPLRGLKGSCWEGGIRVPMIVRWPGKVAAGSVSDVPIASADIYPTLLDAAKLPLRPEQHRDGASILPALTGKGAQPDRPLVWHFPHGHVNGKEGSNSSAIRLGNWKVFRSYKTSSDQLYDLAADPGESTDLIAKHPDVAGKLAKLLDERLAEFAADAAANKKKR